MKALVTGSAGHLGEALMRTLRDQGQDPIGLDLKPSAYTTVVGSISDPRTVASAMPGVSRIFHTATLHKPHIATHSAHDFLDTNITGTLTLLEAAVTAEVDAFVFTSTTSVFGDALRPPPGAPAAWITEATAPLVKNIYGATKLAAEDLCRLFHRNHGLNCLVLRTSRFFPEDDDDPTKQARFDETNLKANEFLYRRVEIEDAVSAHLCAAERAPDLGHDCFIISATTPFTEADLNDLGRNVPEVVSRLFPNQQSIYKQRGFRMFDQLDRVYVNCHARTQLGWQPQWDFSAVLRTLSNNQSPRSQLALDVGKKGYHSQTFTDGPYPVR